MGCNCKCTCNCNCTCDRRVQVKLKLHGARWIQTWCDYPADAASREVSRLFENKEIDIAPGGVIIVETKQNDEKKLFSVTRNDVTMFDAKEI